MAARETSLTLPLPLQFLAAWLAVWFGRVLLERVDDRERNHQGLDNALIVANDALDGTGQVVRRARLGGLLGFYYRETA